MQIKFGLHHYDSHDEIFKIKPYIDIFRHFFIEHFFSKGGIIYNKARTIVSSSKNSHSNMFNCGLISKFHAKKHNGEIEI